MLKYIIFFMLSISAMADDTNSLQSFCIGIPDNVYTSKPDKVATLVWELWDRQIPKEEANQGWKKVRVIANPSQVYWIYDITLKQIKQALTPTQLQRLKDILPDAGVKWQRDWIGGVMEKYGLEYVE